MFVCATKSNNSLVWLHNVRHPKMFRPDDDDDDENSDDDDDVVDQRRIVICTTITFCRTLNWSAIILRKARSHEN